MEDKPTEQKSLIQVTDNLVQFFELLLKVDQRLQEKRRKESLS